MVEQKHFWNIHQNFIFGKFVGTDEFGNKYYKNKKDDRWVIYANDVEATKITSDWFLWIHHTINEFHLAQQKIHLAKNTVKIFLVQVKLLNQIKY